MSATLETVACRFHTSLNVSNLTRSIEFYRALLGKEPAKQKCDYAKFELDDPPLVLSLIPGHPIPGGALNHVGLRVPDSEALVKIQSRLEAAGIRTQREEGVECCYSKQTKFWVTDPDHTLWEIYVFHEDTDEHDDAPPSAANQAASFAQDLPQERIVWQHRIEEPVPAKIPYDDNSVHEVLFEGTANLKPDSANLATLLTEAFRVLRPGCEVRIHGLTADAPLTVPLPALPGPAAAVQHVPAHVEVISALRRVGFVDVHLEKLSSTAHFTVGQVRLREILVAGRKPGHRPKALTHTAIYLGPFGEVTDDFGHLFRRGDPVPLNIHDWQALKNAHIGRDFLLIAPSQQG